MESILEEIISATVDGDAEKSVELARQAMADGMEPFDVIQSRLLHLGDKLPRVSA